MQAKESTGMPLKITMIVEDLDHLNDGVKDSAPNRCLPTRRLGNAPRRKQYTCRKWGDEIHILEAF